MVLDRGRKGSVAPTDVGGYGRVAADVQSAPILSGGAGNVVGSAAKGSEGWFSTGEGREVCAD